MSVPPYDGHPCPCCPGEVRSLYDVATKLVNARAHGRTEEVWQLMHELGGAVLAMTPLIEAHFRDPHHAFPSNPDPTDE